MSQAGHDGRKGGDEGQIMTRLHSEHPHTDGEIDGNDEQTLTDHLDNKSSVGSKRDTLSPIATERANGICSTMSYRDHPTPTTPTGTPKKPPFDYDPRKKPAKGILKSSPSPTPKSSWLSTLNARIGGAVGDSAATSPTSGHGSDFIPLQASNPTSAASALLAKANPTTLLGFKKFINSSNKSSASLISSSQQKRPPPPPLQPFSSNSAGAHGSFDERNPQATHQIQDGPHSPTSLSARVLRKVRFSVGQLTTEYFPMQHSTTEEMKNMQVGSPKTQNAADYYTDVSTTPTEKPILSNNHSTESYTTAQILNFYISACKSREEHPKEAVVTAIKSSSDGRTLTHLDLSNVQVERSAFDPIADILTLKIGLTSLMLDGCGIDDEALKTLLHCILVSDTVTHLNLANNRKIKLNGFKYIAVYIRKSKSLQTLDLSNTPIDKKSIAYISEAITTSTSDPLRQTSLKTLLLDHCNLKTAQLEQLAVGVRKSTLETLSMRSSRILESAALWIGVMLRDYEDTNASDESSLGSFDAGRVWKQGLLHLDLRGNDIRRGVQYIAQSLRRNRSLASLCLAECKIDSVGCSELAMALKSNTDLKVLDLSRNHIASPNMEGVINLKSALLYNSSLAELRLMENDLTSEVAVTLAETLPDNVTLSRLDLSANPKIDLAGLIALAVSVKMNRTMVYLNVDIQRGNRDMGDYWRQIVAVCTRNTQEHDLQTVLLKDEPDASIKPLAPSPTPSRSSENGSITVSTTRMSLQDRLAAVTKGSARPGSPAFSQSKQTSPVMSEVIVQSPTQKKPTATQTASNHQGNTLTSEDEQVHEQVEEVTQRCVLLQDALDEEDISSDNQPANDTRIRDLYRQCQEAKTPLMAMIAKVQKDNNMQRLLAANDLLTDVTLRFEQQYVDRKPENTAARMLSSLAVDLSNIATRKASLDLSASPTSPAFSIGDDDEDDLTVNHPSNHTPSSLELLRKQKEEEEGETLKKARSMSLDLVDIE
ncbi:hypothetical protein BZG36_04550 [Bifiguratus adelaidae]|uniref:GAT domain-containing protein n=1 Tax=Bifiguratus adelaidae TaxID=1938954 RepID=A0A261XV66_9FUNG|nr:hypothetical protein BZG36_04550 [Bifiguratus adelaidae]